MEFIPNKTSAEMIKEGAFGGTYFRDIYLGANGKWERSLWKEFSELKTIDRKFYQLNKYKVKTGTSQDFGKIKVELLKQILMDVFSGILDTFQEEDLQMVLDK